MKKIAFVIMFLSLIVVVITGCGNELQPKIKYGEFPILLNENIHSVLQSGRVNKRSEVYFEYGDGNYYMGDPDGAIHAMPHFCYVETYEKSPKETHVEATPLTKEQLQKYFGIKIVEWTFSQPIKNTFE